MADGGPHPYLAIIGGGNMAQAILRGGTDSSALDPARIAVAEPDDGKRTELARYARAVVPSAAEALRWLEQQEPSPGSGQVLLAVKPQSLEAVAQEIRPLLGERRRVVISILAGTPTRCIRELLGGAVAVVRAMPNLPAKVRRGVTAVALGEGAAPGDDEAAIRMFGGVGPTVVRIDESLMDAFTAIAGSGPAYVFYLAEAMAKAAVELGFDEATALRIVRETVAGSAAMLAEACDPPAALRAAVTSRGGTTEAAIRSMEADGVGAAIVRAIAAARDRGRELASG